MDRRVVVTGVGLVSPIGIGKDSFWESLIEGKSGIDYITLFDASGYPCQIGGEVRDTGYQDLMPLASRRRAPRVSQFAVAASKLALEDSGLRTPREGHTRVGTVMATSVGVLKEGIEQALILSERGASRINPFITLSNFPHSIACSVAAEVGTNGAALSVTLGCPSSIGAIGIAHDMIKAGSLDVCICGGAETPLFPLAYAGMCKMNELSTWNDKPQQASRPFDLLHNGIVLSEGSCVLILEEAEHAKKREARQYAEISGYAVGNEAYSLLEIEPSGDNATETLLGALQNSHVRPEEIDYISAHGNSCPRWDRKESAIIQRAFGALSSKIPVSSLKSVMGHCFGAAGAFQVACTALSMQNQLIPPTINLEEEDPECRLNHVANRPREAPVSHAVINNFGYGGTSAFLVMKRLESA